MKPQQKTKRPTDPLTRWMTRPLYLETNLPVEVTGDALLRMNIGDLSVSVVPVDAQTATFTLSERVNRSLNPRGLRVHGTLYGQDDGTTTLYGTAALHPSLLLTTVFNVGALLLMVWAFVTLLTVTRGGGLVALWIALLTGAVLYPAVHVMALGPARITAALQTTLMTQAKRKHAS